MYYYKNLNNIDINILHETFLEAFSDYSVNITMPLESFKTMLAAKGFNPEISVGAFKQPENRLVGFILNGKRFWNGKLTAYDMGTGIIPAFRKNGISSQMVKNIKEILLKNSVEQYLLEVIQSNTPAFELYKSNGFLITRSFSVFQLNSKINSQNLFDYDIYFPERIADEELEELKSFWSFSPSWQNSIDSVKAVFSQFVYVMVKHEERLIGYGIVDKNLGNIPQIAVHQDYRNKGIGKKIVEELFKKTNSSFLRIVNVDDSCREMKEFLCKLGFVQTSSQYEMLLKWTESEKEEITAEEDGIKKKKLIVKI